MLPSASLLWILGLQLNVISSNRETNDCRILKNISIIHPQTLVEMRLIDLSNDERMGHISLPIYRYVLCAPIFKF